jgi:hypothetical protein
MIHENASPSAFGTLRGEMISNDFKIITIKGIQCRPLIEEKLLPSDIPVRLVRARKKTKPDV